MTTCPRPVRRAGAISLRPDWRRWSEILVVRHLCPRVADNGPGPLLVSYRSRNVPFRDPCVARTAVEPSPATGGSGACAGRGGRRWGGAGAVGQLGASVAGNQGGGNHGHDHRPVVEQRLNGELRFRTGDRYLAVLSLPRPARRARRKPPEHRKPSKVQTLRPASPRPSREDHPWVAHHTDPDTSIAGRARHQNGPPGNRNGKAPARAVLNSAASR